MVKPFEPGCLQGFDNVVDCLLGTGFQGALRETYRAAIEEINDALAYVVSADINSGMNGDTGEGECIVISDLTVTIGYVKRGLVEKTAGKYIKKLVCTDIGIRLSREEWRIRSTDEPEVPGSVLCPAWLEMKIIPSRE